MPPCKGEKIAEGLNPCANFIILHQAKSIPSFVGFISVQLFYET
jgi:hypothetical protein